MNVDISAVNKIIDDRIELLKNASKRVNAAVINLIVTKNEINNLQSNESDCEADDGWISVDKQLPDNPGFYEVFVASAHKQVRIYEYSPSLLAVNEGSNLWYNENGFRVNNWFVKFWKPCPNTPKDLWS